MKKVRRIIISVILVLSLSLSVAFADTITTIGTTTHEYEYKEPLHMRVQAYVVHGAISNDTMSISKGRLIITNYEDSADSLSAPTVTVDTGYEYYSTNSVFTYNTLTIPAGTVSYYFELDWPLFVSTFYGVNNTTYALPHDLNTTNVALLTQLGVYGGSYIGGGLGYIYSAYWYGNGTVEILDCVANTPYTRYITVSTSNSSNTDMIASLTEDAFSLDSEGDEAILPLDCSDSMYYLSEPIISTDADFANRIELKKDDISINNNNELIDMQMEKPEGIDELYVKSSDRLYIDSNIDPIMVSTEDLELQEIKEPNTDVKILKIDYAQDDLPIIPNSALLITGDGETEVESMISMVFFDGNDNMIGGSLIFCVPNDSDINDNFDYSLILDEQIIQINGSTYIIDLS